MVAEMLTNLGVDLDEFEYSEEGDTLYLLDSDDFARLFSKLEEIDELNEEEDKALINEEASFFTFKGKDFSLNLIADYDEDTYKLTYKRGI